MSMSLPTLFREKALIEVFGLEGRVYGIKHHKGGKAGFASVWVEHASGQ